MTDAAHHSQFTNRIPDAIAAHRDSAGFAGHLSGRPIMVAVIGIVGLSSLGWAFIGAMAAGGDGHILGALGDAICRPLSGHDGVAAITATRCGFVLSMWSAMTLAMMLPTAGPMIVTYAEIADTAARKGESIISPLVLTAGYVAIWLGFASVAAVLQLTLAQAALIDQTMRMASPQLAGIIFLAAGGFQFSGLKHACVRRCQRPFPFFFANWTDEATGVFGLGLRQGLYCLGCCWAMMLVMFAVGVMNVVWMGGLGLVMGLEKIATTPRFSRAAGVGLIAVGLALIVFGSRL